MKMMSMAIFAALALSCGGLQEDQRCQQTQDGKTICVETNTADQPLVCEAWFSDGLVDCWGDRWAKVNWGKLMKAPEPVITVFPVPDPDGWLYQLGKDRFWAADAADACEECIACTMGQRSYGDYVCGLYCRGCGD